MGLEHSQTFPVAQSVISVNLGNTPGNIIY